MTDFPSSKPLVDRLIAVANDLSDQHNLLAWEAAMRISELERGSHEPSGWASEQYQKIQDFVIRRGLYRGEPGEKSHADIVLELAARALPQPPTDALPRIRIGDCLLWNGSPCVAQAEASVPVKFRDGTISQVRIRQLSRRNCDADDRAPETKSAPLSSAEMETVARMAAIVAQAAPDETTACNGKCDADRGMVDWYCPKHGAR